MCLEAQVRGELDAALSVRRLLLRPNLSADDAVVVIAFIANDAAVSAVCARFIIEFPEVVVVTINADSGEIRSHRGSIEVKQLRGSLDDLVQELQSLVMDADQSKG
jgi:hypothetical protein